MLPHTFFIAFFILLRFAFENSQPKSYVILSEFYLNFVYLIDMIRIFTSPYMNSNNKMVYNKKLIAMKYLKGWFILDLYSFIPLGFFRANSSRADGSSTDDM